MILFLADGRLGNQLFQYAFLNSVAGKNEKIVAFNMQQLVDCFDINSVNFLHINLGKYSLFFVRKFVKPFLTKVLVNTRIIGYIKQESRDGFLLPTCDKRKGTFPVTLVETGFFQSERLFDQKKIGINIKERYVKEAREFLDQISDDKEKIFIHVRRGDYLRENYLGSQGIDLPKSYFMNAIMKMVQTVKDPIFVFVTDDPGYVECCFEEIPNKVISRKSMATDLAIMSLCEYGIVSNSSFSWWGAYLMASRRKAIFPKYWYGWKRKVESNVSIQPWWAETIEVEP